MGGGGRGEWCTGERKCAVEKTAEQSVAASDSGKTMMSAATGPTSKLLHTYTSPPRQLCSYTHIAVPLLPLSFLPLPSFPTLPSFPFLPFLPFQFATYYWPAYFASFLTASLPCLPPWRNVMPQEWAVLEIKRLPALRWNSGGGALLPPKLPAFLRALPCPQKKKPRRLFFLLFFN